MKKYILVFILTFSVSLTAFSQGSVDIMVENPRVVTVGGFDYFYFDLATERRVNIYLEVPDNNDFDLELYGENKLLWSHSSDPLQGENEAISLVLRPRRYYMRVIRSFPTEKPDKGAYYTLNLD